MAAAATMTKKVATASQALGAALYQQQASAPSDAPTGDQPQSDDEDVVDAEIVDEDEQK